MAPRLSVGLEEGSRRTFAWAWEWPGWCRAGKGEAEALETLVRYAARYRRAIARAGFSPGAADMPEFEITERLEVSATTDFGAPAAISQRDHEPLTPAAGARLAELLSAAWEEFEDVARRAPNHLRKGPRGGGRDQVVERVRAGDFVYGRKVGIRYQARVNDLRAVAELRRTLTSALRHPDALESNISATWPLRYHARRSAWHVLDHLWEIEDRTAP